MRFGLNSKTFLLSLPGCPDPAPQPNFPLFPRKTLNSELFSSRGPSFLQENIRSGELQCPGKLHAATLVGFPPLGERPYMNDKESLFIEARDPVPG